MGLLHCSEILENLPAFLNKLLKYSQQFKCFRMGAVNVSQKGGLLVHQEYSQRVGKCHGLQ